MTHITKQYDSYYFIEKSLLQDVFYIHGHKEINFSFYIRLIC